MKALEVARSVERIGQLHKIQTSRPLTEMENKEWGELNSLHFSTYRTDEKGPQIGAQFAPKGDVRIGYGPKIDLGCTSSPREIDAILFAREKSKYIFKTQAGEYYVANADGDKAEYVPQSVKRTATDVHEIMGKAATDSVKDIPRNPWNEIQELKTANTDLLREANFANADVRKLRAENEELRKNIAAWPKEKVLQTKDGPVTVSIDLISNEEGYVHAVVSKNKSFPAQEPTKLQDAANIDPVLKAMVEAHEKCMKTDADYKKRYDDFKKEHEGAIKEMVGNFRNMFRGFDA